MDFNCASTITGYVWLCSFLFFSFFFFPVTLFLTYCLKLSRLGHWNHPPFHRFKNFSSLQQLSPHFFHSKKKQKKYILLVQRNWLQVLTILGGLSWGQFRNPFDLNHSSGRCNILPFMHAFPSFIFSYHLSSFIFCWWKHLPVLWHYKIFMFLLFPRLIWAFML